MDNVRLLNLEHVQMLNMMDSEEYCLLNPEMTNSKYHGQYVSPKCQTCISSKLTHYFSIPCCKDINIGKLMKTL